jgi:hypothetical protein
MGLLAFIVRAILFLFVFRLAAIVLRAFIGGFVKGARAPESPVQPHRSPFEADPPKGQIEELVKDPVCGVHTARSSAIAGTFQGAPAWFCSTECAAKAAAA